MYANITKPYAYTFSWLLFCVNLADLLFYHVKMGYNIILLSVEFLLLVFFTILYSQVNCPVVKQLL